MASFVDVYEYLERYNLPQSDYAKASLDLEVACDKVRDKVCQTLDLVEDESIILWGTDTRAMILPELPVVVITSITLDGEAITDFTPDASGILWRDPPAYWPRAYKYEIVYSHGYAAGEVPAIYRLVAMELANSTSVGSSGDITQEAIQDYSVTYSSDSDTAASGDDDILGALDRRIVKRVPMP